MSEQGGAGRYNRSPAGLIVAMAVIVLLVIGLFVIRDVVFGTPQERRPVAVEYRDSVQGLQQNGFDLVYPETLPDGWIVSEVGADLGDEPSYRINLYTDDNEFVGIRQAATDLDDMLAVYVDENTRSADPLIAVGEVASSWEGWSDGGGDHAYSTVIDGESVLVFGGVSAATLAGLVERLGTSEITTR